jgi:hypothetical protein
MPDVAVVIAAFVFVAVVVGIDRWASVKKDEHASDSFKDMTQKYVDAMGALNGGTTGGLVNSVARMANIIEPDDVRVTNGPFQQRNNEQPQRSAPAGWPQPSRSAAESH